MNKYIIYINYKNSVVEYVLPGLNNRSGQINLTDETGIKEFLLSYEVWDNVWYFKSNDLVRLSYQHYVMENHQIQDGELYNGKIYSSGERFTVMVKAFKTEMANFKKFDIRGYDTIVIGSARDAHISINNNFVSNHHAVLSKQNGEWYIFDQSKNGTYVNYEKVNNNCKVKPLDQIYIFGYKLIFIGNILAVNQINDIYCSLPEANQVSVQDTNIYEDKSLFSRKPRFIEPFDEEQVEIEGPPSRKKNKRTPLLFILGPSLTMPLPILVTVLFNVMVTSKNGNTNPLMYFGMVISVIMFAGIGIMWAMLRNKYDQKNSQEEEFIRQSAYMDYIKKNEDLLLLKQDYNRNILSKKYLSSHMLIGRMKTDKDMMWNRNVNHPDFMEVRIGTGLIESPNKIVVPKEKFSVDKDELVEEPGRLYSSFKYLNDAVKLIDLKAHKIIGVTGSKKSVEDVATGIIIQLAALHSYTDVNMAFLYDDSYDFEWTKWLPHTFSKDKRNRFVGNSPKSNGNVIDFLTSEIRSRLEKMEEDDEAGFSTRFVVFCTDKSIIENESLYKYMISKEDIGFTFILLYESISKLPNECRMVIENSSSYQGIYLLNESYDYTKTISFDSVTVDEAKEFARSISGYTINELSEGGIPDSVDYLEMLGIGKVEQWDLLKCYKENRAYEGISSFIGMTTGNKPMYLDIHEKKHGPHGLVAGTTGSGKSETIQTFILSLALNYHPDEVAFILIDYKGGGMANVFLNLPHLAGTITNLGAGDENSGTVDESMTRRALISIRSEIKRRQKIFNQYKINHIDAYIKLYREHQADEPLPHLIIISDEFAELKKEQPEFIRELVSAARVGRSLGMHLILATQKPAGVVDDEIWSNSKFKICLKVQDKQDSIGMLKRPEAAYLTQTGRAYLQIGNDEMFEMFQSGYSGADYIPKEKVSNAKEDVAMIGIDGIKMVEKRKKKQTVENSISQLDACVKYIINVAKESGINNTKPLWLPPLGKEIFLNDLFEKYNFDYQSGLMAIIGEIDNPEKQAMEPLTIDINQMNNLLIVGNSGSGKTNMIQTIIYSLMKCYYPETVQFYILDFSSRTFKQFKRMPHVGDVFYSDDNEGVPRVFKFLNDMIEARRDDFQKKGIGSFTEYQKLGYADTPTIVLVLDNYFDFMEIYPDLEESFAKLARDGSKYGIQIITSVNRVADIRYKTRQSFTKMLPLQLTEKGDYLDVIGKSPEILPTAVPGRGLVLAGEVLEYQTALPEYGSSEMERTQNMQAYFDYFISNYKGKGAARIPVLPENKLYAEDLDDFGNYIEERRIPIAYEMEHIEPVSLSFEDTYCYGISGTTTHGILNFMQNILLTSENIYADIHIVNLNHDFVAIRNFSYKGLYENQDGIYDLLIELKQEFKARSTRKKEIIAEGINDYYPILIKDFKPVVVLIDDFSQFLQKIYDTSYKEEMNNIVELFFQEGKQLGVMFLAGFTPDFLSSSLYTLACKTFVHYKKGIHLGGQLNDQKLFEFTLPISVQTKSLPDNIGYTLVKNKPCRLYVPMHMGEEDD